MNTLLRLLGVALVCGVGSAVLAPNRTAVAQQKANPPSPLPKEITAFVTQHCVRCHGPDKKKADLVLHVYKDEAALLKDRKRWEEVIHMVATGEMPPPERPRPKAQDVDAFVKAIHGVFARNDSKAGHDPGRVTMRRLNRAEYTNTIRDLVGIDFDPGEDLPADDVGYGFDNIGDVLTVSPLLMERYLAVAEAIMSRAIITGEPPKPGNRRLIARFLEPAQSRDVRTRELTKDNLNAPFKVSQDGEYTFRVKMWGRPADGKNPRVALFAEDKELRVVEVAAKESSPEAYEAKLPLKEGSNTRFYAKLLNPGGEPARAVIVSWFELSGPADPYPASHRKLLACKPATPDEKSREVLKRFVTRAYRRPVADDELNRLVQIVKKSLKRGDSWEAGVQLAMQAVLCSPKFLFRVELDQRPDAKGPHPLDDYQLASRLSYFLWSTMPDDELFTLAGAKQLHQNLEPQVRRMLKDKKSYALVENFAVQWLQLRPLKTHMPDRDLFPDFDDRLRAAMLKETELFFHEIIKNDRSILELIDSDFSFVNERLARHYGIPYPGKSGGGFGFGRRFNQGNDQFEKVIFKNGERGGLLTQASILTVNSNPTRTNPVKRGKWVLEQLLNTPPPPPPPNVPELPDNNSKKKVEGTLRQRLEQHRKDPSCAVCHSKMDPLGLAFENYNAIGKFRAKEGDLPIDPSGELPGGRKFQGPQELKKILLEKKELFARCVVEKMLTYALGRGLDYYDKPAVDQVTAALAKSDYRFSTLAIEIARSEPFRMRRGKDQQ